MGKMVKSEYISGEIKGIVAKYSSACFITVREIIARGVDMKKNLSRVCMILIVFAMLFSTAYSAADVGYTTVSNFQWDYVYRFSEDLAGVTKGNRTGFVDKTGKLVISPQFSTALRFEEGLALIYHGGKYGYINKAGKIVIRPQFTYANSFSEGLAEVEVNGKCGYIDKTGKIVIKAQWDSATGFYHGVASVQVKKKGNYDFIPSSGVQGPFGMIDKKGKVLIPLQWDYIENVIGCKTLIMLGMNRKYGIADMTGKILIKPQWSEFGWFEEGFDIASYKQNGKWGIFDKNGKIISTPQWDDMIVERNQNIAEGMIPVRRNGKWGFLDYSGKVVIEPKWKSVSRFQDGIAIVHREDGKVSYINKTGEIILKTQWDNASFFEKGLAYVSQTLGTGMLVRNSLIGIIDEKGNSIINTEWDRLSRFRNGKALGNKGFWVYSTNGMGTITFRPGKWYMIDSAGNTINELPWDEAFYLTDEYIAAIKYEVNEEGMVHITPSNSPNLKYGIIDVRGQTVMEPQFSEIEYMEELGLIRVVKNGKTGFLDKSLKLVGNAYWDSYYRFGNLISVNQNKKMGFIDPVNAKLIITPQFDENEIEYLGKDKLCTVKKNGKWGIISIPAFVPQKSQ